MPESTSSATPPAIHQAERQPHATGSRLARAMTPARCYCLGIGLFLLIRGTTTLTGGAGYGLPGDGWRAILQLALATLLIAATTRRTTARTAAVVVGLIYAAQTLLGLHMHDILGIIPIDSRDRIVHPTIAILGLTAAAATRPGRTALRSQPPHTN